MGIRRTRQQKIKAQQRRELTYQWLSQDKASAQAKKQPNSSEQTTLKTEKKSPTKLKQIGDHRFVLDMKNDLIKTSLVAIGIMVLLLLIWWFF